MAVLEDAWTSAANRRFKDGKSINNRSWITAEEPEVQNQDLGHRQQSKIRRYRAAGRGMKFSQKYSKESRALLTDAALQQNPEVYQQQAMAVLFQQPVLSSLKGGAGDHRCAAELEKQQKAKPALTCRALFQRSGNRSRCRTADWRRKWIAA